MLDKGIYVVGFYYPVVPQGQARIRVQLSAAHTRAQLNQALAAFREVGRELGTLQDRAAVTAKAGNHSHLSIIRRERRRNYAFGTAKSPASSRWQVFFCSSRQIIRLYISAFGSLTNPVECRQKTASWGRQARFGSEFHWICQRTQLFNNCWISNFYRYFLRMLRVSRRQSEAAPWHLTILLRRARGGEGRQGSRLVSLAWSRRRRWRVAGAVRRIFCAG